MDIRCLLDVARLIATGEVKIVEMRDFPELRARGWYKGDFHAHIIQVLKYDRNR